MDYIEKLQQFKYSNLREGENLPFSAIFELYKTFQSLGFVKKDLDANFYQKAVEMLFGHESIDVQVYAQWEIRHWFSFLPLEKVNKSQAERVAEKPKEVLLKKPEKATHEQILDIMTTQKDWDSIPSEDEEDDWSSSDNEPLNLKPEDFKHHDDDVEFMKLVGAEGYDE